MAPLRIVANNRASACFIPPEKIRKQQGAQCQDPTNGTHPTKGPRFKQAAFGNRQAVAKRLAAEAQVGFWANLNSEDGMKTVEVSRITQYSCHMPKKAIEYQIRQIYLKMIWVLVSPDIWPRLAFPRPPAKAQRSLWELLAPVSVGWEALEGYHQHVRAISRMDVGFLVVDVLRHYGLSESLATRHVDSSPCSASHLLPGNGP